MHQPKASNTASITVSTPSPSTTNIMNDKSIVKKFAAISSNLCYNSIIPILCHHCLYTHHIYDIHIMSTTIIHPQWEDIYPT